MQAGNAVGPSGRTSRQAAVDPGRAGRQRHSLKGGQLRPAKVQRHGEKSSLRFARPLGRVSPAHCCTRLPAEAAPRPPSLAACSASARSFSQGCNTGWHVHDCDQVLIVTSGIGIVATETEQREIKVGDVAHIKAGERHWHGAKADTTMSHIT